MARPTWSGVISFGLVSVPVKAYTATRDKDVRFHRIERGSGARIKQQNLSAATGEPVEDDDIVMGYELAPGKHVTFEREEVAALRPDSTKAVTVLDFVDLDEVDPFYFDKTYWLGPDGAAAVEPYELLLEAMEERNRVAIGAVVMRNKGRLAAIRPMGGLLAMSTMRYADEVIAREDIDDLPAERAPDRLEEPRPPVGQREQRELVVRGSAPPARCHGLRGLPGSQRSGEAVGSHEDAHDAILPRGPAATGPTSACAVG